WRMTWRSLGMAKPLGNSKFEGRLSPPVISTCREKTIAGPRMAGCTGDVVTIDPEGYVKITDRTKDLIKSGGEWISSVDVENAIVAHPCVAEAAVIAVPHP